MPDLDLEIRGGGGGGGSPKILFRPFGPQFGLKVRGCRAPAGPSLGSATEINSRLFTIKVKFGTFNECVLSAFVILCWQYF